MRLTVKAKPGARVSRVLHVDGLSLEIALAAPPVDGAANEELIDVLRSLLGVRRQQLELSRGASSRHKQVLVHDVDEAQVTARLAASMDKDRPG